MYSFVAGLLLGVLLTTLFVGLVCYVAFLRPPRKPRKSHFAAPSGNASHHHQQRLSSLLRSDLIRSLQERMKEEAAAAAGGRGVKLDVDVHAHVPGTSPPEQPHGKRAPPSRPTSANALSVTRKMLHRSRRETTTKKGKEKREQEEEEEGGKSSGVKESGVWLNVLAERLFEEVVSLPGLTQQLRDLIEKKLNPSDPAKKPDLLGEVAVHELELGPTIPHIESITTNLVNNEIRMVVEVVYEGGLSFAAESELWINWPVAKFASLPVSLGISLLLLRAKLLLVLSPSSSSSSAASNKGGEENEFGCCLLGLLGEPEIELSIRSILGYDQQLRDVPKIAEFLTGTLRQMLRKMLALPIESVEEEIPRPWHQHLHSGISFQLPVHGRPLDLRVLHYSSAQSSSTLKDEQKEEQQTEQQKEGGEQVKRQNKKKITKEEREAKKNRKRQSATKNNTKQNKRKRERGTNERPHRPPIITRSTPASTTRARALSDPDQDEKYIVAEPVPFSSPLLPSSSSSSASSLPSINNNNSKQKSGMKRSSSVLPLSQLDRHAEDDEEENEDEEARRKTRILRRHSQPPQLHSRSQKGNSFEGSSTNEDDTSFSSEESNSEYFSDEEGNERSISYSEEDDSNFDDEEEDEDEEDEGETIREEDLKSTSISSPHRLRRRRYSRKIISSYLS
ncbi:ERMES complex subunit mmm1 [Balamuthia mandrillaris]